MGLPIPNPFAFPDSPEQLVSDLLLHGAIGMGTAVGVGLYTGAWAGPGTLGTIAYALFDTAPLGASGVVAFEETMFALSVYAEPFVAVGNVVAPLVAPLALIAGTAYVAHKIQTDPSWQSKAQKLGSGMDFSSHFA